MACNLLDVSHLLCLLHEDKYPLPHHREAQGIEEDVPSRYICTIENGEVEILLVCRDNLREEKLRQLVDEERFIPCDEVDGLQCPLLDGLRNVLVGSHIDNYCITSCVPLWRVHARQR